MKKLLLLLIGFILVTEIFPQRIGIGIGISRRNRNINPPVEQSYYISWSTGNDSNDGLTPATAKKTYGFSVSGSNLIRKVYFKRGDTWSQFTKTISSTDDSITIGAYGSGPAPKLMGSKTITGWIKRSTTDVYVSQSRSTGFNIIITCIRVAGFSLFYAVYKKLIHI